jgi:hypothetical protein
MYSHKYIRMYLCTYTYVRTYVFMYVGMYIIYHLCNISTGCTCVFRMTVTATPRSIAIALLGPM